MGKENKKFNIVIDGFEFVSDEDGFLDLNDIWRGCKLPENKRPNQWRGLGSSSLFETCNLQSRDKQTVSGEVVTNKSNLVSKTIVGDEVATIAYAMWISLDFYKLVIKAFVALRNGELTKAYGIAQSTTNVTAENAFDKWLTYADTPLRDACGMLGIRRVMLFMSESRKTKSI